MSDKIQLCEKEHFNLNYICINLLSDTFGEHCGEKTGLLSGSFKNIKRLSSISYAFWDVTVWQNKGQLLLHNLIDTAFGSLCNLFSFVISFVYRCLPTHKEGQWGWPRAMSQLPPRDWDLMVSVTWSRSNTSCQRRKGQIRNITGHFSSTFKWVVELYIGVN